MADEEEVFNSSDLEFEAPPEKGDHYGLKSIEAMLQSAFEDRVESKKASKHLTDDVGSPVSRAHKFLVYNRFKAFCTATLKKSVDSVPVGEDIIRFFTTITSHMTSIMGHVPRYSTQVRYLKLLITKLIFAYPKFLLSAHERQRISVCLKSLLQERKLTKDPQREAQWVSISLVKRMVKAMIEEAVESGTRSWDATITKTLSIVLLGVLGCRCGDITLSAGYKNVECLRWEHIRIKLKPGTQKLSLRITLAYEKGHKDDPSRNRIIDIDALDSPQDNALCPVKWLLIHALRHGCVQGNSLDDIVSRASQRLDKSLVWTNPKYPVLASMKQGGVFLNLSKPALANQLQNTVKYAGLVAGLLVRITPHDLRRGCFQDMMKASVGPAMSLTDVADTMNHTRGALQSGVTAKYTNGVQDPAILEKRIRGAEVAGTFDIMTTDVSFKRRKISEEEIIATCERNGVGFTKENDRNRARSQIRNQDTQQWMEARKNDLIDVVHSQAAQKAAPRPALGSLSVNIRNNLVQSPGQKLMQTSEPTVSVHPDEENGYESMIDPVLRTGYEDLTEDDEVNALKNVSQHLVTDLEAALSQSENFELNENMHAVLYPISAQTSQDDESIPWETDAVDFITFFSQINVVRNTRIEKVAVARWAEEAKTTRIVATGNTRDMPTPYRYPCTNKKFRCQYHSHNSQDVQKHIKSCKVTSEEAAAKKYSEKSFKCTSNGCTKSFPTEAERSKHYSNCHSYIPKGCSFPGCDPNVIFPTATAWQNHVADQHLMTFPRDHRCTVPGCKSTTPFSKAMNFTQHLVKCHNLNAPQARRPYVPTWRARSCPEAGCQKSLVYQKPGGLVKHLLKDHNIAIDVSSDRRVAWD